MGFHINIEGIDGLKKAIVDLDDKVKNEISKEMHASGLKIQADAKKAAPVNFGQLRSSIILNPDSDNSLTYIVAATASYSAYVEFGTGPQTRVPSTYEELASQFGPNKGGGGKLKDMVDAIMLWGIRKGYIQQGKGARTHAYFIARKILQKGLRPQPFLIPAFENEKPKLIKRIKDLVNA